ncbi:TetR/AcrR family transcriptional regulator [Paenibacillus sp. sgz500958]|uniref:TetR/AcrR family transcriptional regulator n=1 Tax=Paenibacillus sp. sgz500958 TaxID=3242475 RepID=UPI0036D3058C
MTKEDKKEREREEMRRLIIETAGDFIAVDGIEKLSIRKLARQIGYSPGIIYHYFEGKEEIIEQVLQKGYQEMVSGIRSAQHELPVSQPDEILKGSLLQFIRGALAQGSQYRNVMLNDSPAVLSQTSVLFKGAALERNALGMLCRTLKLYPHLQNQDETYIERTAQIIWSSAFGLIMRLSVEHDLPDEQREALVSHYLDSMVKLAGCI